MHDKREIYRAILNPKREQLFFVGTVTGTEPLQVRLDGDTADVPATNTSGGFFAAEGDRVVLLKYGKQFLCLGVINGVLDGDSGIDEHVAATATDNVHGLAGQVITESGSNGNGSYIRFGDGTQVCWAEVKAPYFSGSYVSVTWTYPKPFYSEPEFVGATLISPNLRGSTDLLNADIGPPFIRNSSETSVVIRLSALGGKTWGASDEIYLKVEAKGFWK